MQAQWPIVNSRACRWLTALAASTAIRKSEVEPVHQLADSAHQFLTGSGEGHGIATEDVEANICFKLLDLPTDIWLRNVKTLGGSAEVQLLSDGQYVLQFSERGRDAHTLGCL